MLRCKSCLKTIGTNKAESTQDMVEDTNINSAWIWLREHLSTYKELVDKEAVGKQKELMLGTLRGVLRAKVEHLRSRAVPDLHFPPGWL